MTFSGADTGQLRVIGSERMRVVVDHPEAHGPVLVFCNGMGTSLDYWDPVIAALPDLTCIRFDRPGLGGSAESPVDATDIRVEVERVLSVADGVVTPRRPLIAVGHSYGGIVAETAARLHPDRVSGLVLVDGTDPEQHANDDTRLESVVAAAISTAVKVPGFARLVGSAVERVATHSTTVAANGPRLTSEQRALVTSRSHIRNLFREDLRLPAHCRQVIEIQQAMPFPHIPVVLLVGSEARTVLGTKHATSWVSLNARRVESFGDLARLQILRSAHLMMFDVPIDVAEAIRDVAQGGER